MTLGLGDHHTSNLEKVSHLDLHLPTIQQDVGMSDVSLLPQDGE